MNHKIDILANLCEFRPKYHLSAPINWLNDPVGCIYLNHEYHLFYQHNPHSEKWGDLHWGHAKSKNLIYWEHLPVALYPSIEKNEEQCFSGSSIIYQGVPYILYTSISNLDRHDTDSETWLAKGSEDLVYWTKYNNNPVQHPKELHPDLEVSHWRDPYVFKKDNRFYCLVGGRYNPKNLKPIPAIFLYSSKDLINWKYESILKEGKSREFKSWECPNLLELNDDTFILIISPFDRVRYTLGTFDGKKFDSKEWNIFDHGQDFYATSCFYDNKNRHVVVGWILKGCKKCKTWSGSISLPRKIELEQNGRLSIKPIQELHQIRALHQFQSWNSINLSSHPFIIDNLATQTLELLITLTHDKDTTLTMRIFQPTSTLNDSDQEINIIFNINRKTLQIRNETSDPITELNSTQNKLHIFIDVSIIEIFINYRTVFSKRVFPSQPTKANISIEGQGNIHIESLHLWPLQARDLEDFSQYKVGNLYDNQNKKVQRR